MFEVYNGYWLFSSRDFVNFVFGFNRFLFFILGLSFFFDFIYVIIIFVKDVGMFFGIFG